MRTNTATKTITATKFTSRGAAAGAAQQAINKGMSHIHVWVGDEMPEGAVYEDQRRYYIQCGERRFYSEAAFVASL